MTKKSEIVDQAIDRVAELMKSRGWAVDPGKVEVGDRIRFREGGIGDQTIGVVAAKHVSAVLVRFVVHVGEGGGRRVFVMMARDDRDVESLDEATDWKHVCEVMKATPEKPEPRPRKTRARKSLATEAADRDMTPEDLLRTPHVEAERDPTDLGLSSTDNEPVDNEEGREVDEEADDPQMQFPETLPSEQEARANVERLRGEWEEKRREQERQTPIAKKYATSLAKAKKAESLAYEALVSARATLDRVVGFAAVRS